MDVVAPVLSLSKTSMSVVESNGGLPLQCEILGISAQFCC